MVYATIEVFPGMKLIILKKKSLVIFAVVLSVVMIAIAVFSWIYPALAQERKLPIYCVDREDKKIAISFDACYGAEKTEQILATLDYYDVQANYFMVEQWVSKNPEKVQMLHKSGRIEIGTHSKTHPHMAKLTSAKINEELASSKKAIEDLTGQKVTLFRAPYGEYNNSVIEQAQANGLYTIQWDVDSLDWKGLSASQIASRVIKNVKSGSIILMHNDGQNTVQALPMIILALKNKGYEFVKISDLIYKDNYKIDNTGKQIAID